MAKKGTYISHDTRVKEIMKVIESIGYRTVFQQCLTTILRLLPVL